MQDVSRSMKLRSMEEALWRLPRVSGWRRLPLMVSIAALPIALNAQLSSARGQPSELVIVTSGGSFEQAMRKNFYDAFTAKTGIKVKAISASYAEQWAKARAMAQAGQTVWDIVTVGVGEEASNRELLLKLDCAAMPGMAADAIPNTCRDYTMLRTIGGTVLAYNTNTYRPDRAPQSWKDFWNVKEFPGPRAIPNYGAPYIPLALSLVADDVSVKEVANAPIDVERALRKLDAIKQDVAVWWKTGDQSLQAFRNGDVHLSMMWSGRALQLQKSGLPIALVWNAASAELSSWAVLKDAPSKAAAIEFLDFFVTRPEAHLAFSSEVFWDTPNREAIEKTHGSVATFLQRFENMVTYDPVWLAANRERLSTRWNEWLSR